MDIDGLRVDLTGYSLHERYVLVGAIRAYQAEELARLNRDIAAFEAGER